MAEGTGRKQVPAIARERGIDIPAQAAQRGLARGGLNACGGGDRQRRQDRGALVENHTGKAGEIIGGGQREDNLQVLEHRIDEHGLNREDYKWYLDLRRYGSVPHAGFGLGVERTVAWLTGVEHVRETIPFPRMLNTLKP